MSEAHDSAKLQPRVIRFRDAPYYLGMDRNRFNAEVRPYLTEIPIGKQGVGFDRLELDAWLDEYVTHNGRPAEKVQQPSSCANARAGIGPSALKARQSRWAFVKHRIENTHAWLDVVAHQPMAENERGMR
jgi:hypothetical protein